MLRRRLLIACPVLLLLFASSAAVAGALEKGAVEIAGSASFASISYKTDLSDYQLSNETLVTIDAKYGYCLSRNWEIAPQLMLSSRSSSGSSDITYAGALSGLYNFAPAGNNTVPYVELGIGFGSIRRNDASQGTSILPEASAGLRFLLGGNASLNLAFAYARQSVKYDASTFLSSYTETQSTFGVQAGLSVFPRGFGKK